MLEGMELSKRTYLPLVIKCDCPNCETQVEQDYNKYPLCYPITGSAEPVYLYCNNCSHEWEYGTITLNLTATIERLPT